MHATFFLNGQNWASIYDYTSTVQRMNNEGHQIGSHTYVVSPPLVQPSLPPPLHFNLYCPPENPKLCVTLICFLFS